MFTLSMHADADETEEKGRRLWLGVVALLTMAVLSIGVAVNDPAGFLRASGLELVGR